MKQQTAKEQIRNILEKYGGETADKTTNILLSDPALKELTPELEFLSKNWRDALRPAMIKLACETVAEEPQNTEEIEIAMSLMNLSFYLWDDMVDNATRRLFNPTFFGKFGKGSALIIGGVASAKAFTILNQAKLDQAKRQTIAKLFWDMWTKMSTTEAINLRKRENQYCARDKLLKIEAEAEADLGNCLKMGAVMGDGLQNEIESLGKYGLYIGIIWELIHDFQVSVNLTLELAEKVKIGAIPYALLLARERSTELHENLKDTACEKSVGPREIGKVVQGFLAANMVEEIEETIEDLSKKAVDELAFTIKKAPERRFVLLRRFNPNSSKKAFNSYDLNIKRPFLRLYRKYR